VTEREAPPPAVDQPEPDASNSGTPPEPTSSEPMKTQKTQNRARTIEDEAIRRCLAGEPDAFGVLVTTYQDRIHNSCLRVLRDREAAAEMTQETFLRAFEKLATFRRGARFSTWLYAIAINLCRSELRRRKTVKHRPPLSLDAAPGEESGVASPPSRELDPAAGAVRSEAARRIEEELAALPLHFREPIVLRDIEGLSYDEISDVLEVPIGTVRSRIHRARETLRGRLKDIA